MTFYYNYCSSYKLNWYEFSIWTGRLKNKNEVINELIDFNECIYTDIDRLILIKWFLAKAGLWNVCWLLFHWPTLIVEYLELFMIAYAQRWI